MRQTRSPMPRRRRSHRAVGEPSHGRQLEDYANRAYAMRQDAQRRLSHP